MVEGGPSQSDITSDPPDWQRASVADLVTQLDTAVRGIQESDLFQRYLIAQARFHHYSWGNVLLILAQRPAATRPAPAATQAPESGDPTVAPARREGDGPFTRLIIRGATLIDGTGAPPRGLVDIVIEGNQITQVASVGYPGVRIDSAGRPRGAAREINAEGMYVMPGLVDLHVHQGTRQ